MALQLMKTLRRRHHEWDAAERLAITAIESQVKQSEYRQAYQTAAVDK